MHPKTKASVGIKRLESIGDASDDSRRDTASDHYKRIDAKI
jgi:hypothetical protein